MRRGLPVELLPGPALPPRARPAHATSRSSSGSAWAGCSSGVGALIVVLAVMTGFQDGIRDQIIAANPHLLSSRAAAGAGRAGPPVAGRVRAIPGVRSATPFVLQQALFTSPGGGATGGLLRGVDLASPDGATELPAQLRSGRPRGARRAASRRSCSGRELARLLGVLPGDFVTVISPQGAITAVGMVPKMRRYMVAGTIEVGMHEYDSSIAYLPPRRGPGVRGAGAGVTGVEVKLDDPFEAKRGGPEDRGGAARAPFWVRDWMDMNRNLFAALQLEKLALFVDRDHHRAGGRPSPSSATSCSSSPRSARRSASSRRSALRPTITPRLLRRRHDDRRSSGPRPAAPSGCSSSGCRTRTRSSGWPATCTRSTTSR